jgi:predicted dehydrogenase
MSPTSPSVAVVGCGAWGRNLARNFAELGELAAVVDRDGARRAEIAGRFGARALSLDEAVADAGIGAFCIATPPSTHYAIGMAALGAGKHLLVEKPLTLDRAEAEALAREAAARGLVLMVGHILRYHPAFRRLEALATEGALGRLRRIHASRLNLGAIRAEEDALWCLAPHDVSMILALARDLPQTVTGFAERPLGRAPADAAAVRLGFAGGLSAMIQVSWLHPVKEHRLSVIGSEAMAVFDDTRPWGDKLVLYRHRVGPDLAIARGEPEPVAVPEGEPLKEECRHFLAAAAVGRRPPTDADEALRVMDVLARAAAAMAVPEPELVT